MLLEARSGSGQCCSTPWVGWFPPGDMGPCGRLAWSAQSLGMPVENNRQAARRFYEEVTNGRNLDASMSC